MSSYVNVYMNSLPVHFMVHPIHGCSWIQTKYHEFRPLFMEEIILAISEGYSEEYREKYRDFMEVLKRTHNWIHQRSALNSSVWQGQAILPLLLQSKLPQCQQDCLAELQCQYLPPWSCQTLSSGCQRGTNLNLVVILVQTCSLTTAGGAWQFKFSPVQLLSYTSQKEPYQGLPIAPSESRYMTSVQHSESLLVVVRLRRLLRVTLINCQHEVTNALEEGNTSSSN